MYRPVTAKTIDLEAVVPGVDSFSTSRIAVASFIGTIWGTVYVINKSGRPSLTGE